MADTTTNSHPGGPNRNGKSIDTAVDGNGIGGGGFRPQAGMTTVIPPQAGDLQKSYASIVGDDPGPKGWYGAMGKDRLPFPNNMTRC